MSIKNTVKALQKTIHSSVATYAAAKAQNPLLEPHKTAIEATAALSASSELAPEPRNALTLALIREQQRAPHPLWQAMLVVAYEPMLAKLARRPGDRADDRQEREGVVLAAFLEAIMRVPQDSPPTYIALHLRGMTSWLAQESRKERLVDDADDEGAETRVAPENPETETRAREIIASLLETHDREVVAAFLAIHVEEESVIEFVERVHGDSSASEKRYIAARLLRETHSILLLLEDREKRRGVRGAAA